MITHFSRENKNDILRGQFFENFVVAELTKQSTWSSNRTTLYHYRTLQGQEVDILLENSAGDIVALEIKSASTVTPHDFKGINRFKEAFPDQFLCGIVLYAGSEKIAYHKDIYALPITSLWTQHYL